MSGTIVCTKCSKGKGEKATVPLARYASLSAGAYLCQRCASSEKGYLFPVSKLKSYIDFSTPPAANESHIRRALTAQSGPRFVTMFGATTCYENLNQAVKRFGRNPCFGQRTVVGGKPGPYKWQTYSEVQTRIFNLGSGLVELGLKQKDRVGLYSVNRPEWVLGEYACYAYNLCTVPLYDTLGPEAAEQIIKRAGITAVIASLDKAESLFRIVERGQCPDLKHIILMPLQPFDKAPAKEHRLESKDVTVWSFEAVERLGAEKKHPHTPATPDDLATLCFTSGTTGTPKGAMITHRNMVSDVGACHEHGVQAFPDDVHISFLPLAHVFERLAQGLILSAGASIAFSRGVTDLLLEDVEEAKPTIFVGVPRLFNRIHDKVLANIESGSSIKRALFNRAFASKKEALLRDGTYTHALWDRLIFSKIAAKLGGRCRIMITGSAPISDSVMHFLRVAFSCAVVEGYGQTEANAAVTVTPLWDQKAVGNVGVPLPCCDVKLVDVPEMNYTSKDVIDGVPCPRGEIWVRGTNVFAGYWKDPEQTAEALDAQGWLHSGDIGMWLPDGSLKIIDRKKNIFKLAQGEYIAPEKIENIYQRGKFLAQCFVYGDSLKPWLVAVVIPDEETLGEWARANKVQVSGPGLKALIEHPAVKPLIEEEMKQVAKEAKLHGFEQARAIHLHHEPFSVENQILTPTFKLKRDFAKKVFAKEIAAMYAQIEAQEKGKPAIKSKL